jgi:hypothetical protein
MLTYRTAKEDKVLYCYCLIDAINEQIITNVAIRNKNSEKLLITCIYVTIRSQSGNWFIMDNEAEICPRIQCALRETNVVQDFSNSNNLRRVLHFLHEIPAVSMFVRRLIALYKSRASTGNSEENLSCLRFLAPPTT